MDLKHATKSAASGGTWSDYTVDWGSITGEWTSIALDSNNRPWISFVSETWDRLELAHVGSSTTTWSDSIVDSGKLQEKLTMVHRLLLIQMMPSTLCTTMMTTAT